MRNLLSLKWLNAILVLFAFLLSPLASSQKKPGDVSNSGSVKLTYHFPVDKPVKYMNTSKIVQKMDINGQEMLVNVSTLLGCSIKVKGNQDKNLLLEITVDSMAQNVESPQGTSGGVFVDVIGKVFTMILSPEGKEVDLSEAKKIVFNVEGSGESDVAQSFIDFFPDMPAGSVSPGYLWTTSDTIESKTNSMSMKMIVKADNKLEGFENFNGINCAKISAVFTGTREMNTQTQGMDIHTTGTFTGTGELFFAVAEGYFLKQSVTNNVKGTIEVKDQNMTFPVVMDITSVNEIRK
jgi:hypothetical protein